MNENDQSRGAINELGYTAGVCSGVIGRLMRGKHMSAAIVVVAGSGLLLGGAFISHDLVQVLGCLVGAMGLVGWVLSSRE